jgi:hypothetical protein
MTDLDPKKLKTHPAADFSGPFQVWYKLPRGQTRFTDVTDVFVLTMTTLAGACEAAELLVGGYVRRADGAVLAPAGQWVQPE